ncbi:MAG: CheR family methyltransferase [Gammaproteobacteria bacterium]
MRKRSFNADPPDVAGGPAGEAGLAPGQRSPPLIVGVGVSPGCDDALSALLAAMPPRPGMAFVVVWQQRDDGDGTARDALAQRSAMPVREVQQRTSIEPNIVYIPAPRHTVAIEAGEVYPLRPKRARNSACGEIDRLFTELASGRAERAVGVVLSGGKPCGEAGLREIKERGGLTVVDEPGGSALRRLPRSPFDTAHIDMILPVARIPEKLVSYARHACFGFLEGSRDSSSPSTTLIEEDLLPITELLRAETNHDFRRYRKNTLWRRVQRRMGLNQIDRISEYVELLRENPSEVQALRRDLLICVTRFFRDEEAWAVLDRKVLRELVVGADASVPIRAWIPGCATGEEAYTLAMLLKERLDAAGVSRRMQIFATDVAEDALDAARAGIYPSSIENDVSPERLARFFVKEGEHYKVSKALRECVVFAEQNVLAQPPFSRLDLICCRNLLIYLEPEAQQRVISVFQYALKKGGCLFLGNSETVGTSNVAFAPISKKWRIFRRTDQPVPPPVDTFTEASVRLPTPSLRVPQSAGHGRIPARGRGIAERVQRQLLRELERGVAVVDAHDRLLYVHGSADLYLQLSLGEVDADYPDVVELAREGLRSKLRSALKEARRTGQRVATESRVQREERIARCKVVVRPLEGGPPDEGTLLVTFEPLSVSAVAAEDAVVDTESELVRELQAELAATREQLNSTIEDLEAANDALKAAHEEAISINEELQSGNEELETSKEELQSLNEELTTLNHQLEAKVAELQSTTNDLDNLLTSSNVPTIFLDAEWRIRRYTPSCLELFNLIPSDVGRPLTDISSSIDDPELLDEARQVLHDLKPRERQVQSRSGERYYQRRVLPYRTSDKRVEGVVVTYSDVTQLQRVALKLSRRERQQKALASLGQAALIEKDIHALFDIAVRTVQKAFDAEFVKLLELLPDGKTLLLRAGVGWREGLVGRYVIDRESDSQAALTLISDRPVVVTKLEEDERFKSPELLVSHGIVSGISTVIRDEKGPIGVLGVHTTHEATFSDDDIDFMETVAHILSDAYLLRRGEQALQEAEERLRLATAAHDLGTWDYDVRADRIVASARAKELLGVSPHEEMTYGDLVSRVHPEDRPRVEEAARRCLSPLDGGHCDIEYRTLPGDDGSVRWIRDIRQAYFSDGRAVRVIGTFEDVTQRKEAEQANFERLELAERLRRIAEATPGTVFTFKVRPSEGRPSFPYMAPNASELYGLEPGLLTDDASLLFARIPDEDNERLREVTIRSAETMSMWHAQFRYDHPKKGVIWVEAYASPVAQPDGTILWHGIAHDITNQKQTEMELREARRIAEAADKAKSEFLANMSHEIRTPMSAILGYAEILASQLRDPDNLQSLETIRTNGLYLLEIIDDILDLSRIEAGKLELDRRRVRPDTIVREVQSLLKLHAMEKGLALEIEFDGPLPETIETDPTRLKQILINLVENAIKFTDSGSVRIVVGLLPDESKLRIDVVDTGPGIPDEIVERLFQPFTQADSSVTRRFGGSGLGLSICRALSRMLGGDVTVKTRSGAGSTFTVTVATGALDGVEMFEPESKPLGQRFEVGDIRSLSCRVLVVDDRRDMRYLAQHMLEEAGARVSHAADGREALEQVAVAEAQGDPFDVVLLDMQMPMLDGYAAARALRERGYDRPIIALTANAMKSYERRCLESGCDDYLSKPLSRATLVNTVAYYASDVTLAELAERRRAYGFRVPEAEEPADGGEGRLGATGSELADEDSQRAVRVLVVDDNRDSCTLLRLLLQNSGCDVATAVSGGEALSAVDSFKPTVAVIDIGLPDIGGDELVGALKSRADLGPCRFICLSGRREGEIDWRGAGFDHFVQKPASFDVLKRLILGD